MTMFTKKNSLNMIGRIFIVLTIFTLTACDYSTQKVVLTKPAFSGQVFVTTSKLFSCDYEIVGEISEKAIGSWTEHTELYEQLATEAKKLGGNAVINISHDNDWNLAIAKGTVVFIKDYNPSELFKHESGKLY